MVSLAEISFSPTQLFFHCRTHRLNKVGPLQGLPQLEAALVQPDVISVELTQPLIGRAADKALQKCLVCSRKLLGLVEISLAGDGLWLRREQLLILVPEAAERTGLRPGV